MKRRAVAFLLIGLGIGLNLAVVVMIEFLLSFHHMFIVSMRWQPTSAVLVIPTLLVLLGSVILYRSRGALMTNGEDGLVPVGVGNRGAQERFLVRHQAFLQEYPKLFQLYSKIFIRQLKPRDEAEWQALSNLPDNDPAVIAFEDRWSADLLVFYLGRMAADDFGEIMELAGNGAGFGSFIHLRGMYERLIHAMYIANNPSEARVFAENSPIQKLNYLTRLLEMIPEMKKRYDDNFMDQVRKDAKEAKAKQKEHICPKCLHPKTSDAWTRISLDVMARQVDPDLEKLYAQIYLEGTYQIHANSFGIERRLVPMGTGYTYKEISEDEAAQSIQYAHRLIVKVIDLQNQHFTLGHNEELAERFLAYNAIWGKSSDDSSLPN